MVAQGDNNNNNATLFSLFYHFSLSSCLAPKSTSIFAPFFMAALVCMQDAGFWSEYDYPPDVSAPFNTTIPLLAASQEQQQQQQAAEEGGVLGEIPSTSTFSSSFSAFFSYVLWLSSYAIVAAVAAALTSLRLNKKSQEGSKSSNENNNHNSDSRTNSDNKNSTFGNKDIMAMSSSNFTSSLVMRGEGSGGRGVSKKKATAPQVELSPIFGLGGRIGNSNSRGYDAIPDGGDGGLEGEDKSALGPAAGGASFIRQAHVQLEV
jgi:hypothetical protein